MFLICVLHQFPIVSGIKLGLGFFTPLLWRDFVILWDWTPSEHLVNMNYIFSHADDQLHTLIYTEDWYLKV